MRIIGGEYKGRKISGKGLGMACRYGSLRATSSKVRESVFNILGGRIKNAVFADLYSGTGAVGFEAMSRGAGRVFFVEADRRRAGRIRELISGCGCRERAEVINSEVMEFISESESGGRRFDVVFLDPPYDSDDIHMALKALGSARVLADGAVVIAEHMSSSGLAERHGMLVKEKEYKYGNKMLTLYGPHGEAR